MANGWGGRRTGAGAPKGNNNAVIHGGYCRPCIDVDTSSSLELRRLNVAVCMEQFSLPDLLDGVTYEQRQWFRLAGISDWVVGKLIQLERKKSRERIKLIRIRRTTAKAKLAAAKADLLKAKTRYNEAKIKKTEPLTWPIQFG